MDVLAPLILFFLAAFVVALVWTSRRQREGRRRVFAAFAERYGFEFRLQDDGSAERIARGFDEFAIFDSPSLGRVLPQSIVSGRVEEGDLCVFYHATRQYDGCARPWYVCLLRTPDDLSDGSDAEAYRRRHATGLGFEVGYQARDRRLAVHLADRNADLTRIEDLETLVTFARGLCRAMQADAARGSVAEPAGDPVGAVRAADARDR